MTTIDEIAPQLFRISTYVADADLQMAQFVAIDDEPLLFHTGPRRMFPVVREAVARLLDPARIRWIGFSHFEPDECGSLNDWLALAPRAEAVCSLVGKIVCIDDVADRPARALAHDEVLTTGALRWRFQCTPHVPHCWDAGLLFEETQRTLLCSDLFHQNGDVEAVTSADIMGRVRETLLAMQASLLAHYIPYTAHTAPTLRGLADLQPRTVATMHGTSYIGDGAQALRDLAGVYRDVLGGGLS